MISLLVGLFLRAISRLLSGSPEDTCAATRSPPLTKRSPLVDKMVATFDKEVAACRQGGRQLRQAPKKICLSHTGPLSLIEYARLHWYKN